MKYGALERAAERVDRRGGLARGRYTKSHL